MGPRGPEYVELAWPRQIFHAASLGLLSGGGGEIHYWVMVMTLGALHCQSPGGGTGKNRSELQVFSGCM